MSQYLNGFKITDQKTIEAITEVMLCKWLHLTPDQVKCLPYEDYLRYSIIVTHLESKSIL